jgi:hypothetical protein
MKLRTTLALFAVLLALGGAYWALQQRDASRVRETEAAKQLFAWKAGQVQRLEIARVGEGPSAAERVDAQRWRMVLPNETIPPLHEMWSRVAEHVAGLRTERTLKETHGGPEAYGLAQPALTVAARLEDGSEVKAVFGNLDPTQTYRFARLGEGDIFLASTETFFELNRSLQDLRHRFLVDDRETPLLHLELVRIYTGREEEELENPPAIGEETPEKVILHRENKDAPWVMVSPVESPANQELVGNIVKELQFTVGRDFIDAPEDLSDYGLQPANWRVTMVAEGSDTPQTVMIGDPSGEEKGAGLYVRRVDRPGVFVMDAHIVTLLPRTPDAYRERRMFTGPAKEIQSFTYQTREGSVTIARNAQDIWEMTQPEGLATNQILVSQFLGGVMNLQASGFKSGTLEQYGLQQPLGMLTIQMKDRPEPVVLRWTESAETPDVIYGTLETGAIVEFSRKQAAGLLAPLEAFRSHEVARIPADAAQRMELQFNETAYVFEKAHGKWVVVQPEGQLLANQTDAENILKALNPLLAEAIEPPGTEEALLGFDRPAVTVTVTLNKLDGQEQATVVGPLVVGGVAKDNSQQRYARIEGSADVYRVGQEFVQRVREAVSGLQAASGAPNTLTPVEVAPETPPAAPAVAAPAVETETPATPAGG